MKKITVFIFIFIFISCNNNKKNETEVIVIKPQNAETAVNEFFNGYFSIPLETNQENLIANIDKIEIKNEKIYILDKRNYTINIFDMNGFFTSRINKRGQGPEEYIDIADFTISENLVYVLSRTGKKIVIFNETGTFIKSYILDDYYDYFYIDENEIYLYSNYSNNKLFNIILARITENGISYSKEFLPFLKNQSFSFSPTPFNKTTTNELLICQQYDFRIYNLKNSITTECDLHFVTKDKIPKNIENKGFDNVYQELSNKSVVTRITHANRLNDHLFIMYNFEYNRYITKIDVINSTVKTLRLEFNDIYPFVFSDPLIFHNGYLVGYLHSANVLPFNNQFTSDKNKNNYLSEEDNPVLFFHKLK